MGTDLFLKLYRVRQTIREQCILIVGNLIREKYFQLQQKPQNRTFREVGVGFGEFYM